MNSLMNACLIDRCQSECVGLPDSISGGEIMDETESYGAQKLGITNTGCGTTNADAGVGIGLLGGIQKFD